jgi:hypothetical protein
MTTHAFIPPRAKRGEVSAQRTEGSWSFDDEHDPSGPSGHLPTLTRGEELDTAKGIP